MSSGDCDELVDALPDVDAGRDGAGLEDALAGLEVLDDDEDGLSLSGSEA